MSAKLLLNLVEAIARKNEPAPEGRDAKGLLPLFSLVPLSHTHFPSLFVGAAGRILLIRILECFVNKFGSLKQQIRKFSTVNKTQKTAESVKECRMFMKTLVLGLKNIVWGISTCPLAFRGPTYKTMSLEETLIYTSLLKNGLKCFPVYAMAPEPSPGEEKDVCPPVFFLGSLNEY
jgi:ribosomal protein L37AE/L43A